MVEIGKFTYSYRTGGQQQSVEFTVEDKVTALNLTENEKRYQGSRYLTVMNGDQIAAYYSPYADIFQVTWRFDGNAAKQRQFEAQFRKKLPEYLSKAGYLDEVGEVKPDGNEVFRIKLYQWFLEDKNRKVQDFVLPDEPDFTSGNDRDNPLTWPDTPERRRALVVYFRLMYQEVEALKHKREEKAYTKIVDGLRKELYRLYDEQRSGYLWDRKN